MTQEMEFVNQIVRGDCLKLLPDLPRAAMVFADPPDNLGCKYEGFKDRWANETAYTEWLSELCDIVLALNVPLFWLSFNARWISPWLGEVLFEAWKFGYTTRLFMWRFTFGQHRDSDCGSGYRPLLRLMRQGTKLYPDAIRIPSARQTTYNDKRADPRGRVPDDVWDFPRVCGTFRERKRWHPCQHPKDLLRRMVLLSTQPGDIVIDCFAGSGNMLEVCKELERPCIGIEISDFYCKKIAETSGAELVSTIVNREWSSYAS